MRLDVEGTVFIVGSGRSGTTVLYRLLATHPHLAWFSGLTNRYPHRPGLARLHRLLDLPLVGSRLRASIVADTRWARSLGLSPSEGERVYWTHCGLRDDVRSTEEDLDPRAEGRFRAVVEAHLEATGRPRFLTKRTANNQRIRLLAAMFPRSYWVHIIRDGRAVSNSFLNVEWWPRTYIWWAGTTPEGWEARGRDPIRLCALHWERNVGEVLDARGDLAHYLELRYEDLVRDPRGETERVLDFAGIPVDGDHMELVPPALVDQDVKWRRSLSREQVRVVEAAAGDTLRELGYLR